MELSLCAKPSMSYAKSHCNYQPRKIITMSCKTIEINPENFYKLLSLSSKNAKIDEIKKAYRNMALKYHPDVCRTSKKEESQKIFVQLNEAYKVLSDPILREQYDYGLSLSDPLPIYKNSKADELFARKRCEGQISELKRQSSYRENQNEGSWGRRMRARNGKF